MTYIKKIVMQGFKSFARKTEIPLENSMNVIVGPNGSGKSNITDALCFVLGRLSIKSIRAAKAANLLFSGNKMYKGSAEASVEVVFENKDKTFGIEEKELSIKRIVRKNGQSIYKINNQTKTRQDIIETLAQAGIDPNGFNIVLQGEIQSLVKATPDERRKIIEEVAGISIYETRKQKSLRELEKAGEKLKEVSAVLKERNAYLRNLDKERQDAMQHKKLEETICRCKLTLLSREEKEKEKDVWGIEKTIENHEKEIRKIKQEIEEKEKGVEILQEKITKVNKKIQSSTGNEQEAVHRELSDLRAELAGLSVRKENFESRIQRGNEFIKESKKKVEELNEEIIKIRGSSPEIKKEQEKQKSLQEKFDLLEKQRRTFYVIKSDLQSLESQKQEKQKILIESEKEIELIKKNIETATEEIKYVTSIESFEKIRKETSASIKKIKEEIEQLKEEIIEKERENAILKTDIKREENLKKDITGLQNCPICKQEVREDHKHNINRRAGEKITTANKTLIENERLKEGNERKVSELEKELEKERIKLNELEIDFIKINNAEKEKIRINKLIENKNKSKEDLEEIHKKLISLKENFEKLRDVEDKYDEIRVQIQELSFTDLDVDTEITIKTKELNRIKNEIKSTIRDIEDSTTELKTIIETINSKEKESTIKQAEEQELYEKAQKLFEERNELQDKQKVLETDIIGLTHTAKNFEDKINHNKIQKAQITAQIDSLKTEMKEFESYEVLQGNSAEIKERLSKAQFRISRIGSVNMRALDVFDKVQEQVSLIEEKVNTIKKEEEEIQKIILEIDKKKKKAFITTLTAVNELFRRNFSQLSKKGETYLELENKKEPFEGGLNILVKASRGRYFDITSLSGGEKTMVALALIFAIQEYRPYCFYIFDEIDAALDKHNSELLAALIKKYMTSGQYIIITHNDTLITEATNLYGVSMQENLSKVISLKV